jgi:Response regulator containing CheY-like receiver, AAA-type ATPase, and DNA-binding domains
MTSLVPPVALRKGRLLAGFVKILLVDDNTEVRDLLTFMLSESGFLVITAVDGLMGLKVAEAERPDLIITDIEMPRLDGIQMIARLRGQLEFSEVPILAVSAYGKGELDAAISAGANQALQKPIDFDFFLGLVSRLLPVSLT